MYWLTGLTRSFHYAMGLQDAGIIHNNFASYEHWFFHVRPPNQPTITVVDLYHTKAGRAWFTETRVIW
jgi:hypothetical protein